MIVDKESEETQVVYPGKMLVQNVNEMLPGEGTYVYLGKIYSELNGRVKILKAKTWHN